MRGLGFNTRDVDGADELAGGNIENPISHAIIAAACDYYKIVVRTG
jgi:hypothetical protein